MGYLNFIEWQEFIEKYDAHQIEVWVDINKGHALMKSQFAPMRWRIFATSIHYLIFISMPVIIVLFFYYKWWIPVIIFVDIGVLSQAFRRFAQKAVLRNSLKNPEFYHHAFHSGTMGINSIDNLTGN